MMVRRWVCWAEGERGANKIHMNVRKPLLRNGNVLRKELGVAVSFGGVASCARLAPMEDITRKVRPNILGGDQAAGSTATRMG